MQMSVSLLLNFSYCAKLVTSFDCLIIAEQLMAANGKESWQVLSLLIGYEESLLQWLLEEKAMC